MSTAVTGPDLPGLSRLSNIVQDVPQNIVQEYSGSPRSLATAVNEGPRLGSFLCRIIAAWNKTRPWLVPHFVDGAKAAAAKD